MAFAFLNARFKRLIFRLGETGFINPPIGEALATDGSEKRVVVRKTLFPEVLDKAA